MPDLTRKTLSIALVLALGVLVGCDKKLEEGGSAPGAPDKASFGKPYGGPVRDGGGMRGYPAGGGGSPYITDPQFAAHLGSGLGGEAPEALGAPAGDWPDRGLLKSALAADIKGSGKPAFALFYGPKCGGCHAAASVIAELADEYKGKIDFFQINSKDGRNNAFIPRRKDLDMLPILAYYGEGMGKRYSWASKLPYPYVNNDRFPEQLSDWLRRSLGPAR